MAQNHGPKLVRALQHEKQQRERLQDMVETLAQQHSKLEQAANAHTHRPAGMFWIYGFLFGSTTQYCPPFVSRY